MNYQTIRKTLDILLSVTKHDLPGGSDIPKEVKEESYGTKKQAEVAIKRYAPDAVMDEYVFVHDPSMFGSGKGGFLITTEGFAADEIYKNRNKNKLTSPIPYVDIAYIMLDRSDSSRIALHMRDGRIITEHVGPFAAYIKLVVNKIIELVSGNPATELAKKSRPNETLSRLDLLPSSDAEKDLDLTADEAFAKGNDYYLGNNLKKDWSKAVYWLEKAASLGHGPAAYRLSRIFEIGCESVRDNILVSIEWLKKAAELGVLPAQYDLALLYVKGDKNTLPVSDYDNRVALTHKWMKRAAENGFGDAKKYLASFEGKYRSGESYEELIFWCNELIEDGDTEPMLVLAKLYEEGDGVPKDMDRCISWLTRAAENGNADAMVELSWKYDNGDGVPFNEELADYWAERSIYG